MRLADWCVAVHLNHISHCIAPRHGREFYDETHKEVFVLICGDADDGDQTEWKLLDRVLEVINENV